MFILPSEETPFLPRYTLTSGVKGLPGESSCKPWRLTYTGVWVDWSMGLARGTTITLSSSNGNLLAFIATFVTVVSVRLWRILCFASHQALATRGSHDGLYYQRQHILRNTTSPMDAAWHFILQSWYWRGVADKSAGRAIPWAVCGTLYVALFGVLAIFFFPDIRRRV
jgi:hypothetical protein